MRPMGLWRRTAAAPPARHRALAARHFRGTHLRARSLRVQSKLAKRALRAVVVRWRMGCGASSGSADADSPAPSAAKASRNDAPQNPVAAPAAGPTADDGIGRNAGGCEEPHSDDPELWNIDGTEMDLNAKYKVGGQMWYLQDRAKDAIKAGKPIAGEPFNQKAKDAGRLFDAGDDD